MSFVFLLIHSFRFRLHSVGFMYYFIHLKIAIKIESFRVTLTREGCFKKERVEKGSVCILKM